MLEKDQKTFYKSGGNKISYLLIISHIHNLIRTKTYQVMERLDLGL